MMRAFVLRSAAILLVRRKEIQWHVAPIILLLRIELMHRHQLNRGHTQFLQVRDLLDDSGKRAPFLGADARLGPARKATDVHLVDDVPRLLPAVAIPGHRREGRRQHSQRRLAHVRSGRHGGLPAERRRKMHRPRVRVQQHLGGIERVPAVRPTRPARRPDRHRTWPRRFPLFANGNARSARTCFAADETNTAAAAP